MIFDKRRPLVRLVIALALLAAGGAQARGAPDKTESLLDAQRLEFRHAVEHVRAGRLAEAELALSSLADYALAPYLELEIFKARLDELSDGEVAAVLTRHDDTVVGYYMERALLSHLAGEGEWQRFLQYAGAKAPRGMRCEYIYSLRKTGQDDLADQQTQQLWMTGYSLPKRCDPVLNKWLKRLTAKQAEDMRWRRAELALKSGQSGLALYLLREVPGTENYQSLLKEPALLSAEGSQLDVNAFSRELVLHTLERVAAVNFEEGNSLWHQLSGRFQFTHEQNFNLRDRFARQIIAGGAAYVRDWINANDPDFEDEYLTEWRVRLALKDGDWEAAKHFISALPEKLRRQADWRYWWARADMEIHQRLTDEARDILEGMASERGYYSFLSADLLNQDYQLGAKRTVNRELLKDIASLKAVQRARELYWHGLVRNADIEWRRAVRGLEPQYQVAAAQLALDWNWPHAAVATAIRAGEWDDLELRFPLAFPKLFKDNAKRQGIDLNWAYAIARQESAFAEHAQSRVGARGVMQLMPGTARTLSRRMGRAYPSLKELHTPAINIEMGSFYLGYLLQEFDGNHILATAAYNAGPGRVKRFLARQGNAIAADIWIENLPYGETREYIKNVLAFSVVYGLKLKACKTPSVQSGCNTDSEGRYTVIAPVIEDESGS